MLVEGVIDLLFPPRCGGCGRSGSWFCEECRRAVRPLPDMLCPGCSRPCSVSPCPMCAISTGVLDSLRAWFALSGPIREAIHRLKYEDRPRLAAPLVELGLALRCVPGGVVVPVPLGPERLRSRGYNQAEVVARRIASARGRACLPGLFRTRETEAQVGRGGEDRRRAMHGAFAWRAQGSGHIPDEIVVVDDVVTTGATLMECALAARAAGVRRVHGLAIALG